MENGVGATQPRKLTTMTELSGSKDEDEKEPENEHQSRYFVNEEKVIRNHLKLNVALQFTQIILFCLAVSIFDWAHVVVSS